MKKTDIPGLTGLRGLAALLIVIHHVGLLVLPLRGTVVGPALGKCGLLGMSIFFVLSGFVIHYNYAAKVVVGGRGISDFLIARFARLYPLYAIFVLCNFVYNHSAFPAYAHFLPVNLLGIQSWIYSVHGTINLTLSQVYANNAWSISTELMLYLMFIPLAMFARLGSASFKRGITLVVLGIVGRIVFVHFAGGMGNRLATAFGESPALPADQWLIYFSPYGRIFEFIAGVGLSELWSARALTTAEKRVAGLLGTIGFAYILTAFLDASMFSLPNFFEGNDLHIGYAVAVPLAIFAICLNGKILCGKIALWIGEISYSLYLVHGVMIPIFGGTDSMMGYALKATMFISTLIIVATLTHAFVEMPSKNLIMSLYKRYTTPSKSSQSYT